MGRRLTFFAQLMAILLCSSSMAVGLSEIELDSALNQNFEAKIEVTGAESYNNYEILVRLASEADFERVGIERFFYLTFIEFSVNKTKDGLVEISMTSNQPVSEPYLNFLVEVRWPNGRLLKEYTVLLDPPTFSEKKAPVVAAPGRTDPGGGGGNKSSVKSSQQFTQSQSTRQTETNTSAKTRSPSQFNRNYPQVSDERFEQLTNRNDTLWTIASNSRPSAEVSTAQTMLALQRLNPEAFIHGNINLLKAGYHLTLPTEAEVLKLSKSEADAHVAQHDSDWQAYRSGESLDRSAGASRVAGRLASEDGANLGAQLDATPELSLEADTGADVVQGELRIVTGSTDSAGLAASGETNASLSESLSESAEEIERISRENDELQYRLDLLTDREAQAVQDSESKNRQIELKDQRLAEMQAQLKEAQVSKGVVGNADNSSIFDLLTSPLVLLLAGLVLLLALGLIFVSARARRQVSEAYELIPDAGYENATDDGDFFAPGLENDFPNDRNDPLFSDPVDDTKSMQENDFGLEDEESGNDSNIDNEDTTESTDLDDQSELSAQTSDVVGEADIYIAYGRYPQALALLNTAIDVDASRTEVRLKLLEVAAETDDRALFDEHMQALIENCDDEEALLLAREISGQFATEDGILDQNSGGSGAFENDSVEKFTGNSDDELDFKIDPESEQSDEITGSAQVFDIAGGSLHADDALLDADALANAADALPNAADALPNAGDSLFESDGSLSAEGSLFAEGSQPAEGSLFAEGSQSAEGSSEHELALDDALGFELEDLEALDADSELIIDDVSSEGTDKLGGDLGLNFDPDEQLTQLRELEDSGSVDEFDLDDLGFVSDKQSADLEDELGDVTAIRDAVTSGDGADNDDAFDFLDEEDVSSTKLDLARAYIDMGDEDGAREILAEVIGEGSETQQTHANELLSQMKSG
ncbi:MAG: hypothetical protein KUG75_06820 [Pseudomonadales bacterium]|nr:hypothetical protein [Pseudomonadales bacterium]